METKKYSVKNPMHNAFNPRPIIQIAVPDDTFMSSEQIAVTEYLKRRMKSDETFITLTNEAIWYYYLNRPCPIRFPAIWFAEPPKYQRECVSDIQKNSNIKYVIDSSNYWSNEIDTIPNEERVAEIFSAVKRLYKTDIRIGSTTILVRKD